jgi:hypothetical protein
MKLAAIAAAQPLVGIACSPQIEWILKRHGGLDCRVFGVGVVPLLIDPRMSPQLSEAYFDAALWKARCKEQEEWDAKPRATAA